jgi:hypothetical protein
MNLSYILKIFALAITLTLLFACDSQNLSGSRVSIGTTNTIYDLAGLQYQQQFVVQVTNRVGDPSPNIYVDFKLQPLSYNKGVYIQVDTDIPPDGTVDSWVPSISITCNSEDANNNGALDGGEDLNANGRLDPAVPAISQHPDKTPTILAGTASLITDENGFGYLAVTYPKSEASWVRLQLTAEAQDGLDGNVATYTWTLPRQVSDFSDLSIDPPGGVNSPYGTNADCTNPT